MKQIRFTINNKRVRVNLQNLIAGAVIILLLLGSLIFSLQIEYALKLKPDFSLVGNNSLEVHFVNVGQGDSILIRMPNNQTMIVDSGPKKASEDLIYYIDNVFFRSNNNKYFDYFLLTHSDADHAGGALDILNNFEVKTFFRPSIYSKDIESEYITNNPYVSVSTTKVYENLIAKLLLLQSENKTDIVVSDAGIKLGDGNNVFVNFLSPNLNRYSEINDYSPILMLEYESQKIMLTGDATVRVENEVLNYYDNTYLQVDVLKLGHHGSKTSTSQIFLETLRPDFAIVSASKNNSYGHPSTEVINLINNYSMTFNSDLNNNILNTADVGNIVFYVNSNSKINYLLIKNANDYIYLNWWIVVVSVSGIIIVVVLKQSVKINTGKAVR